MRAGFCLKSKRSFSGLGASGRRKPPFWGSRESHWFQLGGASVVPGGVRKDSCYAVERRDRGHQVGGLVGHRNHLHPGGQGASIMLPGGRVDFRILGPFEAMDDTGPVKLTGGKQKALLALLLLHAERGVSMDQLVDDLWGDEVPDSAQKMVQIFVSQLRKQLPDELLCTRAPGYPLELDGHTLH